MILNASLFCNCTNRRSWTRDLSRAGTKLVLHTYDPNSILGTPGGSLSPAKSNPSLSGEVENQE